MTTHTTAAKTMKTLFVSFAFFILCHTVVGQTSVNNTTEKDPVPATDVNIQESKVTIVKTSEKVISRDNYKPRNFDGKGEKVYISMENEMKVAPAKVDEEIKTLPIPDNTTEPK